MLFDRSAGPGTGLASLAAASGPCASSSAAAAPLQITPQSSVAVPFALGAATSKNKRKKKKPAAQAVAGSGLGAATSATPGAAAVAVGTSAPVVVAATANKAKRKRCAFCNFNSHDIKNVRWSTIAIFVIRLPTRLLAAPTPWLPKPYAGLAGIGSDKTMFSHLPEGVFKPYLALSVSPIAIVTVTDEPVLVEVIQNLAARICSVQSAWN